MRLMKLLFSVTVCICMSATTYGHPGRTDSNGGHYDRSTGEYHYHHGYSAHQHADYDGDGILDCPYDFDDKTDSSTTKSSSSKKTKKNSSSSKESEESNKADDLPKKGKNIANTIGLILGVSCIVAPYILGLLGALIDKIRDLFSK